jgi:hypothetical protein
VLHRAAALSEGLAPLVDLEMLSFSLLLTQIGKPTIIFF